MTDLESLWKTGDRQSWHHALERYWLYVQPKNLELERELDRIPVERLRNLDALSWFNFLEKKYFRWKYTAPNRYATTTAHLRKHADGEGLEELDRIRIALINHNPSDIEKGLEITKGIRGLGTAGASGLLALIFPEYYGTVDQFVVKALREISDLPEGKALAAMNEDAISVKEGVLLIQIMQRKAHQLSHALQEQWTPRLVDKVLWTFGR